MNQDLEEIIYENFEELQPKVQSIERRKKKAEKGLSIDEIMKKVCIRVQLM